MSLSCLSMSWLFLLMRAHINLNADKNSWNWPTMDTITINETTNKQLTASNTIISVNRIDWSPIRNFVCVCMSCTVEFVASSLVIIYTKGQQHGMTVLYWFSLNCDHWHGCNRQKQIQKCIATNSMTDRTIDSRITYELTMTNQTAPKDYAHM